MNLAELESEARRQHPEESDAEIARRVAHRAATLDQRTAGIPGFAKNVPSFAKKEAKPRNAAWAILKILWALAVLLLLAVIAARADELPPGMRNALHGVTLVSAPAFDAPIIFLSNAGTQLAVIPAGKLILNCSTNLSYTWNATTRQFDMTSSATAGTAFSALTASANTNLGTFSASGNTWDFTAATLFRLRVGAGLTTTANGDIGQNSTDGWWRFWFNGADRLIPAATNTGVSGQIPISNGDGTYTNADPLVTYNKIFLLNGVSATAAQTSAATTLSTRMAVGSLNVVGSGITGAPAGCTIAYQLSLGGVTTANIQSFVFTPGNNYQNFAMTPTAANASADLMVAAYTCTTFPTAGTLTVSFSPARSVVVRDALPVGTNTIGGVNLAQYTPVAGRLPVDGSGVTQPVSLAAAIDVSDRIGRIVGQIVGTAPSGAADSGNPVKIGGVFNTTQPTVTTGQRVDAQFSARGELFIAKGVSGFLIDNTSFNIGTFPANQPFNVAQWNGLALGSPSAYGTSPGAVNVPGVNAFVTNTPNVNIQANAPVNEAQIGGVNVVSDPCQRAARTPVNINLTASTQLIAGVVAQQIYICSMNLIVAAADNVALVEGTGAVCATGPAGMAGGATAATGWNLAANGGFVNGTGTTWIFRTATAADNVCLLVSGTAQVSGNLSYVQF